MKKIKSLLSLTLCLLVLLSAVSFAYAAGSDAKLYNVYGDNMLFQQKKEAVFSGTGTPAHKITCKLLSEKGEELAMGKGSVDDKGEFTVSIKAPAGGYKEYTVTLDDQGTEFARLEGVVFGELWLASGQSNMQYALNQDYDWLYAKSFRQPDEWIRTLLVPPISTFGGQSLCPAELQNEIEGAYWCKGTDARFNEISAVAYYFAEGLREKLDMPVGILNDSLGGSAIESWISRDTIEKNEDMVKLLSAHDAFIPAEKWDPAKQSQYSDMSANYGIKFYPLRNFAPAGMIWYQGETNVMYGWSGEDYALAFDLLQKDCSALFGFEKEDMPVIYTQLAPYVYSGNLLENMNYGFALMQDEKPESRAVNAIYDIPLVYTEVMGPIHPAMKREVGGRMVYSACGLVYGGYDTYTAALPEKTEIKDGSVYVTLKHTGAGLVCSGTELYGFAVCDKNGIYSSADAEIVSPDTVRIFNEKVAEPVSATYAMCPGNMRSSLCAEDENGRRIPVSCFVTDKTYNKNYVIDEAWTDCETDEIWHIAPDSESTLAYPAWTGKNCEITFDTASVYGGAKGMRIKGSGKFSVSPVRTYEHKNKDKVFGDCTGNLSDYGFMTFAVKNNGSEDVVFTGLKITVDAVGWYSPAVSNTADPSAVIPADGEWHIITLDLNSVYLYGNECWATYSNSKLENVKEMEFLFSGNADLSFDKVRFFAETESPSVRFVNNLKSADNVFEFFTGIISAVLSVFFK